LIAILATALIVCVGALALGQAALRLCGATEWSWLAPPIGISLAMLIATPANHVPGGPATVAVVVALLAVAAAIWCLGDVAHRPPIGGLTAALAVALLALVPFAVNGRGGTIGVSVNNDMSSHMLLVEAYLSDTVAQVTPLLADYPLGPHALVAVLAGGLGIRVDEAFAGLIVALPIFTAWTALCMLRREDPWLPKALVATVVGMPYLLAAYYAQGAFKEILQTTLVLAVALLLARYGPQLGRLRWVPLALLLAGIVSVYSLAGLPWPAAFIGLWLVGQAATGFRAGRHGRILADLREQLPSIAIGAAALLVVLIPQLPRLERFVSLRNGTGIAVDDIGNLFGPVPGWEAFGVWTSPDFRLGAGFTAGMLTAFVLALVVLGALWALRRGRWMLPLAAASAMAIWWYAAETQSPYVAAKALVIASPLLLALAALPLVDPGSRRPPWWKIAPLLGALLAVLVGISDLRALRIGQVGPVDHALELRDLRSQLDGKPVLFLGYDDFVRWELAGIPVGTPAVDVNGKFAMRPPKQWAYGQALDFDSVEPDAINAHAWVIAPRDPTGSVPPPELQLVETTPSYALWRRTELVKPRRVLAEGAAPGARLDCGTRPGRALAQAAGTATTRTPPIAVAGPSVAPDGSASIDIPLRAGSWDLAASYTSPLPLTVTGPGLRRKLPANLDRPGPRWPIGRLTVRSAGPIRLTFESEQPLIGPASAVAVVPEVAATRVERPLTVPLHRACGEYVDWYRLSEGT
jgi:hypothetical protein